MYPLHKVHKPPCFPPGLIVKQQSDDMISTLPNDVLYHILSFLDTTEVVRTSLLSSNCRYIWTSVPRLNFDVSCFLGQRRFRDMSLGHSMEKFFDFVKQTLAVREAPPVQSVNLVCDYVNADQLQLWLCLCSMRNVQELEIVTDSSLLFCFSRPFVHSTLSLIQSFNSSFKCRSRTAFGNLKSLRLVKMLFPNADVTEKLLSDCGVLEILSLEYCRFIGYVKTLHISAPNLRELTIIALTSCFEDVVHFHGGLKVHAPRLVSFFYCGRALSPFEFSNMPSLNSASMEITAHSYLDVPYSDLWPMVQSFAHAKEMWLSAAFILFFSTEFEGLKWNFTPFHYLRSLNVELIYDGSCVEGLIFLLKLSPNLELLSVILSKCVDTYPWKFCDEDVVILSHHLRKLEVTEFHHSKFLLDFIKLFLRHGKSLEKIVIMQRREKLSLDKLYALQADHLASDAVSMSLISISDSGKKEVLQFVYRKSRVALWKRIPKWKINKSIGSYKAMKSVGSSRWVRKKYICGVRKHPYN